MVLSLKDGLILPQSIYLPAAFFPFSSGAHGACHALGLHGVGDVWGLACPWAAGGPVSEVEESQSPCGLPCNEAGRWAVESTCHGTPAG